jgi:DNA-damage-inducible protein J
MPRTAYLNARIEPGLKAKAERVFQAIGISSSTAITMFYRQVVLRRGLPFDVRIPNAKTLAALEEAEAGGGEVVHGSTEHVFDDLIREDKHRRA